MTSNLVRVVNPKEKSLTIAVEELREFVLVGNTVRHVRTENQLADVLTKEFSFRFRNNGLRILAEGNIVRGMFEACTLRRKFKGGGKHSWKSRAKNET